MLTKNELEARVKARNLFYKFPKYMTLQDVKYAYLSYLFEKNGGNKFQTARDACCSVKTVIAMLEQDVSVTTEPMKIGRPRVRPIR
jgi:hypothetical protein